MKKVPASRYIVFFVIVSLGCAVDLLSKHYLFDWLGMPYEREPYWLIDGIFGFQTSLNQGALFGIAQGGAGWFAVFAVIAFFCILAWLFIFGAARSWSLTVSLGCITAGTLGNLYDRLGFPGLKWNYVEEGLHQIGEPVYAVRDWMLVMIGNYHWPNFNIADSLLVTGAILLGLHAFFAPEPKKSETPVENDENSQAGNET